MAGLQSSNIIREDQPRTNLNNVNIRCCMTLNRQSQGKGHMWTSYFIEVVKVYYAH